MKKPTDHELIELIAQNILNILKRLEHIETTNANNEQVLTFLEDLFNRPRDLITSEEEVME